jgi:GAF domain-containing protein
MSMLWAKTPRLWRSIVKKGVAAENDRDVVSQAWVRLGYRALPSIGRTITSSSDEKFAYQPIVDKATQVAEAEAGLLFLLDQAHGVLRCHAANGPLRGLQHTAVCLGEGLAGFAGATGQSIMVTNPYQTPRFLQLEAAQDKRTGFHSRSILTAPLAIGDRILGVLQVRNKIGLEIFNENDNLAFLAYTAHVASVLDNTRLYARLQVLLAADVRPVRD